MVMLKATKRGTIGKPVLRRFARCGHVHVSLILELRAGATSPDGAWGHSQRPQNKKASATWRGLPLCSLTWVN